MFNAELLTLLLDWLICWVDIDLVSYNFRVDTHLVFNFPSEGIYVFLEKILKLLANFEM